MLINSYFGFYIYIFKFRVLEYLKKKFLVLGECAINIVYLASYSFSIVSLKMFLLYVSFYIYFQSRIIYISYPDLSKNFA